MSSIASLFAAVEAAGQAVRALKTAKASKEELEAAVTELKQRKALHTAAVAAEGPAASAVAAPKVEAADGAAAPEEVVAVENLSAVFASHASMSNCPAGMTPEERFQLCVSVGEECIERSELA